MPTHTPRTARRPVRSAAHALAAPLAAGLITPALAASLLFAASTAGAAPPERSAEGPWLKGRLVVVPKPGLPDHQLDGITGKEGGKRRRMGASRLHLIELPAHVRESNVLQRLRNDPNIEAAELDTLIPPDSSNDPFLGSQWHLPKIGAAEVWGVTKGAGVTIAVLDSGVEASHPDLKDRLVAGYNFYDRNTNTADVYGHGTKVAGAAAATLNNGTGVASVAGAARIMPIRVTGTNGYASLSALVEGIMYAADRGARIANVSFAASGYTTIRSAAQYMKDKGGLVFVSAGNSGTDPMESTTSSLVVVSATDSKDAKTSWSNFGNHVHLAAPGSGIYSTAMGQKYASVSGTSFAAPITAATAALVMSANPKLGSNEVQSILYDTAVDLGTGGRDPQFGYGRIDAAAAVYAALGSSNTPTADTMAPTVTLTSPAASSTVGGLSSVNVSASDNVGVAKVELFVNGSRIGTDNSAPFSFSWDTTTVANGMANLVARACDAAGNCSDSAVVAVNVANASAGTPPAPDGDQAPPVLAFKRPSDGQVFGSNVYKVEGVATDDSGVGGISMSLYIDGVKKRSSSGTGKVAANWDARKLAPGTYTFRLDAVDAAGNASSTSIKVTRK
ncbi:S8 family serine peptidase [Azohydromonas sp.]|uniref:S8 family serine peptidase n=1 Tax=Azohydromonas sp. TaxID=1872666 RepID=UPI002CB31B1A|nr:S8 family serine peptidase [Azohydromonas sp.]HMM87090.1 S8 family serine peptidase [Azohydromonas sp.]